MAFAHRLSATRERPCCIQRAFAERARRLLENGDARAADATPTAATQHAATPVVAKSGTSKWLIAGLIGLAGVAAAATQVGWILFIVGLVLLILHAAVQGRVPPAT